MVNNNYTDYLLHQKGLALLWLWLQQWSSVCRWEWDNNAIDIPDMMGRRFVLGAPKKSSRQKRSIFLGVQTEELQWMKRIQWKRMVWNKEQSVLWLITKPMESPDYSWPDLPSLALGLTVHNGVLDHLKSGDHLDYRNIWWEGDTLKISSSVYGGWHVRTGNLEEHWSIAERTNIKTLKDVVKERLEISNRYNNPGFKGQLPELSADQRAILDPYQADESQLKQFVQDLHPELFNQFVAGQIAKKQQ